jgi:hypothetical protein
MEFLEGRQRHARLSKLGSAYRSQGPLEFLLRPGDQVLNADDAGGRSALRPGEDMPAPATESLPAENQVLQRSQEEFAVRSGSKPALLAEDIVGIGNERVPAIADQVNGRPLMAGQ